ncbi:M23 family metallopeptidase [Sphingomonas sp. LB-2]|uniref:M23 family metallopeptidase n=1 Tax=Sphingomonas caeni TaxID=2984949 RepID=UPI002230DABE|nr:M23 family metallopeptidase [Sphingomonas caeni]MCW3846276.1 M23 family metallopeptidase [Sphingomonas caeni]
MGRLFTGSLFVALLGTCTLPAATQQPAAAAPALPLPAPTPSPADLRPVPGRFQFQGQMIQGGVVIGAAPAGTTMLSFNGASVPLSGDGRFVIGFDRDAGPGATLVATLGDGGQVTQALTVAPRAWDISRLDTLPKYPVPQPEFEKRRPGELQQIGAARAMQTDAAGWRQPFLWPVTGRISTLFGSQRIYQNGEAGAYHSGVDIARPVGTVVLAPADGVVVLAAATPFTLEGYLLMVDHGMGLNSAFMHLSRIDVKVGEHIRRGQPIGLVGMTGRATGPHLHWGMKWRDARVDPLLMAGPMPVTE